MKIIDLLNKIAKGEEVPKCIRYRNWNNNSFEIMLVCKENIFYKLDQLEIFLNDEVEIIEEVEDKEYEDIEPLVLRTFERTGQAITIDKFEDYCFYNFEQIENTLAKVILNQKKIIEKINNNK